MAQVTLKEEPRGPCDSRGPAREPRGPCDSRGPAREPRGPCGSRGPPREHTHREGVEPGPRLKEEEPELCIKQEPQEFPFHMVTVKSEDDEDKSSVLHQRPTEEKREETNVWECGAEAGCSSDPLTQFHSDSEEHTDSSEDTDHSQDYSQEQAPAKRRSYAMVPPDSAHLRDARPHCCPECGKKFQRSQSLKAHMFVHSGEKPFSCSECGQMFRQKPHLQQHQFTHSGVKRHKCPECGKTFRRKSHVKQHVLSHTGEKPHKCYVCEKRFTRKVRLGHHLLNQHHMCPVCEERFPDDMNLKEHLKSHVEEGTVDKSVLKSYFCSEDKPYSCSECGEAFTCKGNLQSHMSFHSGAAPSKCSICDKCFSNKYNLSRHLKERHHVCPVCEERFPNDLQTHMKSHAPEKPHVCPFCEKGFSLKSDLTLHHKLVHLMCPVCEQQFPKNLKLKEHLKTHKEDRTVDQTLIKHYMKPYSCSQCGRGFSTKSNLQTHMFVHTGQKPFQCSLCDTGFQFKYKLQQHVTFVHHICAVCKEGLVRDADISDHLRTHVQDGTLSPPLLNRLSNKLEI